MESKFGRRKRPGDEAEQCPMGAAQPEAVSPAGVEREQASGRKGKQLQEARRDKRQAEEELARKVEELQQANTQLAQLDRMKDNFLSLLSHELRTPISALLGYISILEDELAGPVPEPQQVYLRKMAHESEALLKLVNDILDMNRLQSRKMTFERRPINLAEVVQNVLAGKKAAAAEKNLRIEVDIPSELPAFLSDEQRLGQVLGYLLENGIKFTSTGKIVIRARRLDDSILIEVVDTGAGISPEDLPQLFRIFGQLDASATRLQGGLGLGLALSKGLTEAMGGSIRIDSEVGKGTLVEVRLPFQPV